MARTLEIRADFKKFIARQDRDIVPRTARIDQLPVPSKPAHRVEWWAEEVAAVLGAKSFAKTLARAKNDHYFWDKRLWPYAYIVARSYEDDPILQVVSGKYAGQILLFNHESYYGAFEHLVTLVEGGRVAPELWRRVQPILAKRGYQSGRPTPDQLIAVLLDDKLEGAERISASFDEFYAAVHLYCERHPPKPRPAPKGRRRKITLTEINLGNQGRSDTKLAAGDRVAYVAPAGVGLVALRPGRGPVRVADVDEVDALAVAGSKLYMLSDHEVGSGVVLAASSNGGQTFRPIATGYFADLEAADGGGVWTLRNDRLVHYPSRRARPAKGCDRIGGTGPAGRFVFTGDRLCLLDTRSKSIALPARISDIADVVVTATGAVVLVTSQSGVLRSTDNGASWRTVPDTANGWLNCGARLSTGAIVAAGVDQLLISDDDGQSFAVLTAKLRGAIECVAELGDELLLATAQHVYCVRVSELAGGAARRSAGVRPIRNTKRRAAPLRPLSSFVPVIRNRVWQIQPFDRTKAYVANNDPDSVSVMENGSRIVYKQRLARELPGRHRVQGDWLVYETYPRAVEQERRRAAQEAADWGLGRKLIGVIRSP